MHHKIMLLSSLLAALVTGRTYAYNDSHGPFPDGAKVDRISLFALLPVAEAQPNAKDRDFTFRIPGEKPSLHVKHENGTFFADVQVDGRSVLPPTAFSDFDLMKGFLMAYSSDLNQDQTVDFVVYSFSGGCGLASGYCNVAFILSAGEEYTLTAVTTLFPDESDFVIINKKPYFIHTSFLGVDSCLDRKSHNFWIYYLMAFGQDGITVDKNIQPSFPKIIFYTFKPNHVETTLLTEKQRAALLQEALACVYWHKEH